jgi:hypothetical protein
MSTPKTPIQHEHNAEDTLSQLIHSLGNVLYSGDWGLPEDTHQQLQGAYEDALNGIGTGFINDHLNTLPNATAIVFELPGDVKLEAVKGRGNITRWALRNNFQNCLNKEGEWEYEPMPSSRDDDFFARCRWDTREEAYQAWETLVLPKTPAGGTTR